jgi:arylsulfatase A-like enzyme
MRISRKSFLQGLLSGTALGIFGGVALGKKVNPNLGKPITNSRPNIIVFVADDMRWDTLGIVGNRIIQTPNLDQLAQEGVLFLNHFVTTSICPTSRATIFTGQYGRKHKIWEFDTPLSPAQLESSYFGLLKQAGYYLAFIGKWGLGGDLPTKSFDNWQGFAGQGEYFAKGSQKHSTQLLTDEALVFLDKYAETKPFCLSLSYKAPHAQDGAKEAFQIDPKFAQFYQKITIPETPTSRPKDFASLPEFLQSSEGRIRWKNRFDTEANYQHNVKQYYRLITGIDDSVGQIIKKLKEKNLFDKTAIIFTSDNGFFIGDRGLSDKWFGYEESIRVPLIMRSPFSQPRELITAMTLNVDIMPTILDLAGVKIPESVQGSSLLSLTSGEKETLRDSWFYEHLFKHPKIPKSQGIRTENFKYLSYLLEGTTSEALFDLMADPLEVNNLANVPQYQQQLQQFRENLAELSKNLS